MSGLLALLDDVSAIAKATAASVDDVASMAAKAGSKTAGIIIDDAAVTPKYVEGLDASRELSIIWKITRASFFNKLVILLPSLLLLNVYAPWSVTYLLMLGGSYLCFEGAEKVFHALFPHGDKHVEKDMDIGDPLHLEEKRVQGAIKTDFILSAEIMTISFAAIPAASFWLETATLAVVGIAVTIAVYGSVALIVKMDDVGLWMAKNGRSSASQSFGRWLVLAMPKLMKALSIIGTAAMLWVGGSIIIHGLEVTHIWAWPYEAIKALALQLASGMESGTGFIKWLITATLDGVFGLIYGLILITIGTRIVAPIMSRIRLA
ncbi:DUF808 domain-containing protein [Cognatiyoonia sp.]|uniref:DUF808 domain-containing protein n=1 Tax=Cognatiyoonia sp. TaxID=2211652 RepID=UPI003F6A4F19